MKPPGKKRQPVGDDDIEDDIFDDRSPVKAKKSKKTSSKQTNEDDSLLYRSESYFHHILSECGLTLTVGPENPHILDKDQSVFLKKLNQALLGDSSYPKNVETFREELTEYLDERDHLLGSFIPIKTHRDCKTALRQNQDSLVKLLLQHSEIQTSLFVWLLEKLGLVGIEDGDRPAGSHKVTWVNVPQRILMQFQFLDEIHEGIL